jgi:hypothetical protein
MVYKDNHEKLRKELRENVLFYIQQWDKTSLMKCYLSRNWIKERTGHVHIHCVCKFKDKDNGD